MQKEVKILKLLSISRTPEKLNYKMNDQDYTTWTAMSQYFDEIYLVVLSPDEKNHHENIDKLHIYWIANRGRSVGSRAYFMNAAFQLCSKLIEKYGIDVINIGEPAVSGIPAIRLKKMYKLPLVTQVQGQLTEIPSGTFPVVKSEYIRWITLHVCKRSDRVRTVSEEIRGNLIKRGVPSDKVVCVVSRCDTDRFNPSKYKEGREALRKQLGYNGDNTVIEFTGRVVAYRDLESDILALKEAIKSNGNIRLLVIGDGDDKPRLENITKENGLSDYVTFYGRVPYELVPKMLSLADVFISTPTNEAIARSVLEAMAMELTVIATRVGGTGEAITSGENGMLVDVGAVDQIKDVMLKLSVDKEACATMGKKARQVIMDKFEFNKQIEKFAKIHYGLK